MCIVNSDVVNCSCLGACRIMPFFPISALSQKINARNINYMAALNFLRRLDLRKNYYNPTDS